MLERGSVVGGCRGIRSSTSAADDTRQQAGVEWVQFHDLRRANATGLVLEGIDLKTAQTRLGHTDPRLTLGIYAQASTEAERHAAERLGDRFLPKRDHDSGRGLA